MVENCHEIIPIKEFIESNELISEIIIHEFQKQPKLKHEQ
jgi:hypothetical protein